MSRERPRNVAASVADRLLQRAATEQAQAGQRGQLQAELRLADDLDKTWPVLNLLDALHLLPVARTRLLAHLGEQHRTSSFTRRQTARIVR